MLVPSRTDSTRIPLTIVSRADDDDNDPDGVPRRPRPTLLHVYGAYGTPLDASFSATWLPLWARHWRLAFAHVRGGGDLGTTWHQAGRGVPHKLRSLTDFLACAEFLVESGITLPGGLAAKGVSAGGVPVAWALFERPALWSAVVLDSPFTAVDAAMRDPSLPLTANEFSEWGDPAHDPAAAALWAEHCPDRRAQRLLELTCANGPSVEKGKGSMLMGATSGRALPPILVHAGARDERVPLWQTLHFVRTVREARVRSGASQAEADAATVLHIDPHAGHEAASTKERELERPAREMAFVLSHTPRSQ